MIPNFQSVNIEHGFLISLLMWFLVWRSFHVRLLLIAELCTIRQAHVCEPANEQTFAPLLEGRNLKNTVIACRFMALFYKRTTFPFTLFMCLIYPLHHGNTSTFNVFGQFEIDIVYSVIIRWGFRIDNAKSSLQSFPDVTNPCPDI